MIEGVDNPLLTIGEAAARLAVSPDFIRDEIDAGRLVAHVFQRPGERRMFRISERDFQTYLARNWRWTPAR